MLCFMYEQLLIEASGKQHSFAKLVEDEAAWRGVWFDRGLSFLEERLEGYL